MAYADILRSSTFTGDDIADLIESIFGSTFPATFSTWTPTLSASGSMTFTSTTIRLASYIRIGKLVFVYIDCVGTVGGTPSNVLRATLPVTPKTQSAGGVLVPMAPYDNALTRAGFGAIDPANSRVDQYRYDGANYTAGTATIQGTFFYEAA